MLTKQEENLRKLGEIMGVSKERFDEIMKEKYSPEEFIINDIKSKSVEEQHKTIVGYLEKTKGSFKHSDMVEIDANLINPNLLQTMWENLSVYSYDIENLFLNRFIFDLKLDNKLMYRVYFSIEDGNIFILGEDPYENTCCGGVIAIKDGKFIPQGAITDWYFNHLLKRHIDEGLDTDRQFIANRGILNFLLYILVTNQMISQNREFVTETSRRVNIEPKNNNKKNKKKKKQPKKTVSIRYIKVDGEKIKKISEEKERQLRGAYERHTDQWTKIGHWRHYKSGKKIWIEPTTVKAKNKVGEIIPKIYKIK